MRARLTRNCAELYLADSANGEDTSDIDGILEGKCGDEGDAVGDYRLSLALPSGADAAAGHSIDPLLLDVLAVAVGGRGIAGMSVQQGRRLAVDAIGGVVVAGGHLCAEQAAVQAGNETPAAVLVLGRQDVVIAEQAALRLTGLPALQRRRRGLVGCAVVKDGTGCAVRNARRAAVHGAAAEAAVVVVVVAALFDEVLVIVVVIVGALGNVAGDCFGERRGSVKRGRETTAADAVGGAARLGETHDELV